MKHIILLSLTLFTTISPMEFKNRLKTTTYRADWCTLCYKVDLNQCDERDIYTRKCGHRFCKKCLACYQSRSPKTCPICGSYENRCDMWCDIMFCVCVSSALCGTAFTYLCKPSHSD